MNSAACDNEEVIIKLEEKKMSKEEIDEKVRLETNIVLDYPIGIQILGETQNCFLNPDRYG